MTERSAEQAMVDKVADWEVKYNDASENSARTYALALMEALKRELLDDSA